MASSGSQRCLLRPISVITTPPIRFLRIKGTSNHFSTSPVCAAVAKKNAAKPPPRRTEVKKSGQAFSKSKKNLPVRTGRPPAPGERKAARKRIVLSNTNALEVPDMLEITPEALLDSENVGKVMALPGNVVDSLRAVQAFKTTQAWGMFRRPGMLIREDSVKLANILEKGEQQKSSQVFMIEGDRATGKSMMLLQAMAAAFAKRWIVLHIPEGRLFLP